MKKTNIIKRILLITIIFLCGIDICKAGSTYWRDYYDWAFNISTDENGNEEINGSSVASFKCTYDVKGISGLTSIVFDVTSGGFSATQGEFVNDVDLDFYMDTWGKYQWPGININYNRNYVIRYGGSENASSFNIMTFTDNLVDFSRCPEYLYLGYENEEKNYEIFQDKPKSLKYIEIVVNHDKSNIMDYDGNDLYERKGYDPEIDYTELDPNEKARTDDTRKKTNVIQNYNLESFYNNYLYGNTNFGIINECNEFDKENKAIILLSKVGLSNIKFTDATVEACLFKYDYSYSPEVDSKEYYVMDEHVKESYNNNNAVVHCEEGYSPVRLKKIIAVPNKSGTTLYYGEVCIKNYDYDTRLKELVEKMKAVYNNIANNNYQCEEIKEGYNLRLEYNGLKEILGNKGDYSKGDEYADLIYEANFECLYKKDDEYFGYIAPADDPLFLKGALTCNGLLGAPNSEIRKMLSNILKFIRYGGPILMLLLTIVDLIKTVTSGDEKDFKKVFQNFIKRFIAAALLFFINDIIRLIFLIVGLEYECVID